MRRKAFGFTLIELLMVLGVMGILMGMILPSVGIVREKAQRMATGQKLRQIGMAVAAYQNLTGKGLGGRDLGDWISTLAAETGLREAKLFLYDEDPLVATMEKPLPPVLVQPAGGGEWNVVQGFSSLPLGVAVASGVSPSANPSTTPIAWTRGLTPEGYWLPAGSDREGVYGDKGGFIVFLDGHIEFHRNLEADGGVLVSWKDGRRTSDIREAFGAGVTVLDYLGAPF